MSNQRCRTRRLCAPAVGRFADAAASKEDAAHRDDGQYQQGYAANRGPHGPLYDGAADGGFLNGSDPAVRGLETAATQRWPRLMITLPGLVCG